MQGNKRQKDLLTAAREIIGNLGLTAENALAAVGIPKKDWNTYIPLLR